MPLSWQVMAKIIRVCQCVAGMMGSSGKLVFMQVVLLAEGMKEGVCPDLRANCSYSGQWGLSRSLVADDDGLFKPGPGIVSIIEDNSHLQALSFFPQVVPGLASATPYGGGCALSRLVHASS